MINAISCAHWAEKWFVHGTFHNVICSLCLCIFMFNKSDENITLSSYCKWFLSFRFCRVCSCDLSIAQRYKNLNNKTETKRSNNKTLFCSQNFFCSISLCYFYRLLHFVSCEFLANCWTKQKKICLKVRWHFLRSMSNLCYLLLDEVIKIKCKKFYILAVCRLLLLNHRYFFLSMDYVHRLRKRNIEWNFNFLCFAWCCMYMRLIKYIMLRLISDCLMYFVAPFYV